MTQSTVITQLSRELYTPKICNTLAIWYPKLKNTKVAIYCGEFSITIEYKNVTVNVPLNDITKITVTDDEITIEHHLITVLSIKES